ncbi:hypothetical protein ECFRIK1999_3354, partial [Escherichia coli FRIK1999]
MTAGVLFQTLRFCHFFRPDINVYGFR